MEIVLRLLDKFKNMNDDGLMDNLTSSLCPHFFLRQFEALMGRRA
jgi:hypothetical protein